MDEDEEVVVRQLEADSGRFGGPHKHCYTCYSFKLCSRHPDQDDSCDFTRCANRCGAVFHGCKLEEHQELCPNLTVPCINQVLGCPLEVFRRDLSAHLVKCPASVVICMAEWNRWPVYTLQRRTHIPFKQSNPHSCQGQLDYDLTLRDQRMLSSLKQVPRKTRQCLRNNLTRRYPAVPLPSTAFKKTTEPEDKMENDFIDLGISEPYIGAKKAEQAKLQFKMWEDDLKDRLKGKEIPPKYWEFPEIEKGNLHKHCAYCQSLTCTKKSDMLLLKLHDAAAALEQEEVPACPMISCRWKCGAVYHSCKSNEHSYICPTYIEPDEYEWMLRGVNNLDFRSRIDAGDKTSKTSKKFQVLKESNDFFQGPGEPALTPLKKNSKGVPEPPPMPKNLFQPQLWLDVRLETVTRLQTKPGQMYTFVCAQEFRRDEFAGHSKNVHDDIIGGINNWLEHRCPLSVYGCGFSHRRMFPGSSRETVIFSPAVESFGITSRQPCQLKKAATTLTKAKTKKNSCREPATLIDLPYELLLDIVMYLDSFR